MFARRKHGRGRTHVGIVISRFGRIDGSADRPDLPDPHLSNRVEDSGVDLQTFGINHLGLGGNVQTGANRCDFSVTKDERAVFDGVPGKREDFRMSDCIGGWWLRLSSRVRRDEEVKEGSEAKEVKETSASWGEVHSAPRA